jgi:hypothetical protein
MQSGPHNHDARMIGGIVGLAAFATALGSIVWVFVYASIVSTRAMQETVPKYHVDVCVFDGDDDFRMFSNTTLRRPSTASSYNYNNNTPGNRR